MVRSRWAIGSLALLAVLAVSCSSDDGGDGAEQESTTTTAAADDPTPATDEAPPSDEGATGAVGSVTVAGEARPLDQITGLTSCQLDGSGDLTIAARSDTPTEDGGTFFRIDVYADDPDSDQLSVAVGDIEYVSASPEAIAYSVDGEVVTGTADVEPLFEEGTAQEVTFEVDCGQA